MDVSEVQEFHDKEDLKKINKKDYYNLLKNVCNFFSYFL